MSRAPETVDFALLGHPAGYDHLGDLLQQAKKDFDAAKLRRHQPLLRKFFEWTPSYPTHHRLSVTDPQGRQATGRMIICTFMPDALQSPRDMLAAYQKTVAGCRVAQSLGARIVGLGGFTSIVSGDQGRRLAAELGLAVTSGNSLTAAIGLDQIEQVFAQLEWDLSDRSLAIVGASGDIGRACTFRLAPRARRVLLIGRNVAPLERLREELAAGLDVAVSTSVPAATACDVIITATSAAEPLLDEGDLSAGTLAFDIGYPRNVRGAAAPRADTLLMPVGRARLPFALPLSDYTRLGDPHLLFGCFTEAIVLALTGHFESYSVGQGCITEERMRRILALAHDCGIVAADPFADAAIPKDRRLDQFLSYSTG